MASLNTTVSSFQNITQTPAIEKSLNLFPDFYDESYEIDRLNHSSSEYDGGLMFENGSSILNDYSLENDSQQFASDVLINQLTTPLFYILFMLLLYIFIIVIVFMSAIYSHRKKLASTTTISTRHRPPVVKPSSI